MKKLSIRLPLERFCENIASRFYEYTGYRINKHTFKANLLILLYSVIFTTPVLVAVSILYEITRIPILRFLSLSLSATLMGLFMAIVALISNALMIIYRRDVRFNEKFLYTVSYMVPLLATSAPLAEVIAKLYQVEKDPEIKHELGLILKDYALGTDIITAIKRSIERTRSIVYKDVMTALIQSVQLTTEPERIILQKLNVLIRDKFLRLRQVLTNLTLLFQTYSIMAFLAPSLILILYAAFGLPQLLSQSTILAAATAFMSRYMSMIVPPFFDVWGIAVLLAIAYSPFITVMFYMIFDSIISVL
ncbi:MAG: hypothetical protein GXO23_04355 [Crenarchaeota archaeon]|nr:hypothetical protein [Thermoproteota archaeon]